MKLSVITLFVNCATLALQSLILRNMICEHKILKQEQTEPEETPEPKNPDKYGMYDVHEVVLLDMFGVDEHGLFYTIKPDPSNSKSRVFCSHMCDWCTDRCMCFDRAWNRDKDLPQYSFECSFHPFRYIARKTLRHMSHV